MKKTVNFPWAAISDLREGPDSYLSIRVHDGVSESDIAEIIRALSTISNFFGATLDVRGGSGGGGAALIRLNQGFTNLPNPSPQGPGNRIGDAP